MRLGPYQYLADMVVMHYHNSFLNDGENKQRRRCLVAIAGGLGSGKSTIAGHVRDRVEEQGLKCQIVTLEGFLRPRAELSEEQLNQRGAIDTLDGDAVLHMVQDLRESRPGEDVHLPGFDEHTRETVPDGQVILPGTQVVIIKGTYVLANAQPWRKIGSLVDERWFVFVMPDVARERGARQYLDKGIVETEEEAFRRYDEIGVYTNKVWHYRHPGPHYAAPKWVTGHKLLRDDPSQWFRGTQVDDRDLALINADPVPWIDIGQQSYLKHVHHKLKDQPFKTTHWTVENDKALRGMISEVGAGFNGGAKPPVHLPARDWESMMVNVTITGNIAPGVTWGLLSGRPSKARVLAGPCSTCTAHPWDIMILRDFHTNTSGLDQVSSIASRQFDILLMKMCEDMDYPWVVLAVKDSGPWNPQPCSSNGHCDNSCLGF
ncbi:hypothetical protein INS49_007790 [Diaporthe citri]|uniref:uncharacterized protein n=1 Tax=Diaporthe citri TaxID=83186 RepID=UPI001C7FF590|nr:uncharacterized protein INS49_007790 [Diaporthe citri]KAG6362697.1 hypothetical protein INS49_007790 [Diaporthe citri]